MPVIQIAQLAGNQACRQSHGIMLVNTQGPGLGCGRGNKKIPFPTGTQTCWFGLTSALLIRLCNPACIPEVTCSSGRVPAFTTFERKKRELKRGLYRGDPPGLGQFLGRTSHGRIQVRLPTREFRSDFPRERSGQTSHGRVPALV